MSNSLKIEGMTLCVDYADILKYTLPTISKTFDHIVLITVERDVETRELASRFDNVTVALSKRLTENGPMCRGKAYNECFPYLKYRDWLAFIDCDILPIPIKRELLVSGNLYSYLRKQVDTPRDLHREDLQEPYMEEWARSHIGFYQLFDYSDPNIISESYPENSTGVDRDDLEFAKRWPKEKHIRLDGYVLHLGETAVNWFGRTSSRFE